MVNMVDMSNDEQSMPSSEAKIPEGADFKVTLNNRVVWFKNMLKSQRIALQRVNRHMHQRLQEIHASDMEVLDKLRAADAAVDVFNQALLDAVDSTILVKADQAFLAQSMIEGKLGMDDMLRVFRQGHDEPQPDDAEIVVKPKTRPAKKAAAAKKTVANAQRTKR